MHRRKGYASESRGAGLARAGRSGTRQRWSASQLRSRRERLQGVLRSLLRGFGRVSRREPAVPEALCSRGGRFIAISCGLVAGLPISARPSAASPHAGSPVITEGSFTSVQRKPLKRSTSRRRSSPALTRTSDPEAASSASANLEQDCSASFRSTVAARRHSAGCQAVDRYLRRCACRYARLRRTGLPSRLATG